MRRSIVALCGTAVVVASVLGSTAPAQAHNYLVSSTPAEGSTLTELPERFVITTNDDLLDTGGVTSAFALQVRNDDGDYFGDGCVEVDGPSMSAVPALGDPGSYTVSWQVVSADGHAVSDEFAFEWAPAVEVEPAAGSASPPRCGAAPSEVDDGDAAPEASTSAGGSDVWWIVGALGAVGAAVAVTMLLVRRRR